MKTFTEWLKLNEATFTHVLNRPEGAIQVTVTGDYQPASRGARDSLGGRPGMGPPLEPDENENFEIDTITDEHGQEIEISDEEHEELIHAFFQQH